MPSPCSSFASIAIACALTATPLEAFAENTAQCNLECALSLADKHHPQIVMARAQVLEVRAQLAEAHTAPFSQFSMNAGVTLAPTVQGNSVFSPNTDEISRASSFGLAWGGRVSGALPLWTFGKITNLWDAAEANVRVKEAGVEVQRDAIRLDVRKAYFGLLLAREAEALLADVRTELNKAVTALEESIDRDEGDPVDLLKLQTYVSELDVNESQVKKGLRIALSGLRFYTGVGTLDIPKGALMPPSHPLGPVTRYLEAARLHRPELQMASAGLTARTAQVHLARSQLYPTIGITLQANVGIAPEVADQLNPFVSDPANTFGYSGALGLDWKLDFLPGSARVRYAEAQLEEMRAQYQLALGGTATQVELAYADVVDWKTRYEAYARAVKYARRWLITVQQGIDVGTVPEKELLDPAKAYAQNKYQELNAIMELSLAMSRLAQATGWDAIAPTGS